jgi:hypothetical protein
MIGTDTTMMTADRIKDDIDVYACCKRTRAGSRARLGQTAAQIIRIAARNAASVEPADCIGLALSAPDLGKAWMHLNDAAWKAGAGMAMIAFTAREGHFE